ncbi:MAG: carbamoyltransferase C-terminal domain-containing protein [Candidatus Thiodiazotropha sp.]
MKRNYIGLANSCHDGGVSIVNSEGKIVFAEATERYLQNKRAFNVAPDIFLRTSELISEYCEPDAELVVAYSWSDETESQVRRGTELIENSERAIKNAYGVVPDYLDRNLAFNRFISQSQLSMVTQRGRTIEYEMSLQNNHRGEQHVKRSYEHHLTHAATACFTSPFDEAVCAIVDGYGEDRAYAVYVYQDGIIREIEGLSRGNLGSLGVFYIYVCDMCGFGQLKGEEWKVMGLAPYGRVDDELLSLFRKIIKVDGLNIEFCSDADLSRALQKMHLLRRKKGQPPIDAANIAYAGQQVFSEILFQFLNNLHALGISDNLILGGGCALNSSANGRILENTGFKNLHVFSAPADDGNAIGAALLAYYEDHPDRRPTEILQSPYLGSTMSEQTLKQVREFSRIPGMSICNDAPAMAAKMLSQGKIIGWVQGAAEFGPRALGNRSILADPRSPNVKDQINLRVKFREEYRPFAPSILAEYGADYFENYQESPYMERTLKFKNEVLSTVPGVVHEDGTGRLQTVKREWNERYYNLINKFKELTGIPLVLNTSFNVMGKPISHSVEDALAVFYTTGLDALFIDDILIEKT